MFSVIIPVYNKELYIKCTIESVLKQSFKDFELIIVNDSSTDNSLGVIENFKDNRLRVFTKPNSGVSDTRNYGIVKAQYPYICLLDADDLWLPNYLEELYQLIIKYPQVGFFCGAYSVFAGKSEQKIKTIDLINYNNSPFFKVDFFKASVAMKRVIALTSRVCIKKDILTSLPYIFPSGCNMGEDADVWIRTALNTEVVYSNNPTMLYRVDSINSLMKVEKKISQSYPFWTWYSLPSRNKYKNDLTTRMIYTLVKNGFHNKEYQECIRCLLKCRGWYLLPSRIILYILSVINLFIWKILK